jgi:hypothetical protein
MGFLKMIQMEKKRWHGEASQRQKTWFNGLEPLLKLQEDGSNIPKKRNLGGCGPLLVEF